MKFPEADRKNLELILFTINEVVASEVDVSTLTFYKHEMFNKVLRNYLSTRQIENGVEISYSGKSARVKDYSALAVVFRSILETLTLYFRVFVEDSDPDGVEFRFKCWRRHGLVTRQNFGNPPGNQKAKLQEEKVMLEAIDKEIRADKRFSAFDARQKDKFERFGQWDFLPEKKVLENMGFDNRFSDGIYSYLSSHAHTESAGLLQLWQMELNNDVDMMIEIVSGQVAMIVYCFLWFYIETRPEVKQNLSEEYLKLVGTWKSLFITKTDRI